MSIEEAEKAINQLRTDLDRFVGTTSNRLHVLESAPRASMTPGMWETVYPWVTSKTAIAIYTAAATALVTWFSGIGTTTKVIEVPAKHPVEVKSSVDDVRKMLKP